ncbi:MAG: hypothetical protein EA381_18160 [Planctomycetaceae bacterium]|nr:MAG: hypothetical protein EA381_18160 [Planctomycetaceae bacterium]
MPAFCWPEFFEIFCKNDPNRAKDGWEKHKTARDCALSLQFTGLKNASFQKLMNHPGLQKLRANNWHIFTRQRREMTRQ